VKKKERKKIGYNTPSFPRANANTKKGKEEQNWRVKDVCNLCGKRDG
jgi:hypothetical protein